MEIRAGFSWKLFGIGQRVARHASTIGTLQLPTNLAPTNVKEVVADGTVNYRMQLTKDRLGVCSSPLEETSTMAAQKKKLERTLQNLV